MWSFFEANVRADRAAAVRRVTDEITDEEARRVVSTGKARFLQEAQAAMRRWNDQSDPLYARNIIKAEVLTVLKRKAEESHFSAEGNAEA